MRVINAEHALTARIVQRQRVADAMRTVHVRRNTSSHDLDPEAAADLGDEPVEIEEPIETSSRAHLDNVSDDDNNRHRLWKKR